MASSKTRRNNEQIEIFIEDVRKYECLYEKTHKDYKDTIMKKTIWAALGIKHQITGDEAEKKWKRQRDRYMKEKRRAKESATSGSGTSDVYKPTWNLYTQMDSVLRGCQFQCESTITNIEDGVDVDDICLNANDETIPTFIEGDFEIPSPQIPTGRSSVMSRIEDNSQSNYKTPMGRNTSNGRRGPIDSQPFNNALKAFCETTTGINTLVESNIGSVAAKPVGIIQQFCSYLLLRLDALDKKDQREAMREIEMLMLAKEAQDKYTE